MEQGVVPRSRPQHGACRAPPPDRGTLRGEYGDQNVKDARDRDRGIKDCQDQNAQGSKRHQSIDKMMEQLPSLAATLTRRPRPSATIPYACLLATYRYIPATTSLSS